MSDSWADDDRRAEGDRPTAHPGAPAIEIPLTGGGPLREPDDAGSLPRDLPEPPNWRRLVGVTSLVGTALGILLAVVLLNVDSGDDSDGGIPGGPSTTLDRFDLATSITTPPTLPASEPELAIDPDPTTPGPAVTLGSPANSNEPVPAVSPTTGFLPTYPQFTGLPAQGLDAFDLEAAVARLSEDLARRGVTHIEVGPEEATLDITIVRDPFNDRYRLTLVSAVGVREAIIDVESELSYVLTGGVWAAVPNSALVIGVDGDELTDYLDRLMLGPLRPDTWTAATVQPGSTVFFPGTESIARSFVVELPGDLIPEWQFHDLSVITAWPRELRPDQMTYLVYVDDQGELSIVLGKAAIADTNQLITHQIVRLHLPEVVLLPDPSLIRPAVDLTG